MPNGVLTVAQLEEVIQAYSAFDEFVVDVETRGDYRGDPTRNEVFWISLAGPGRADAIPCGHPLGERIAWPAGDPQHRVNPSTKRHQERRINPGSGREKWFDIEEPFSPPPKQLWVSDVTEALRPLFFSERRKIGHNVKFDIRSLAKYWGDELPSGPYGDTVVAAKLVNENHRSGYRLGACVKRTFRYEYEKIGKAGVERFPYSEACRYSYLDAKYTWLLWRHYLPRIFREGVQQILDLEMELLPVLMDMESTGTPIDEETLASLAEEFSLEMAKLKVQIDKAAGGEINLNARRQVAELIYEKLGHECVAWTETGERSTSAETLSAFSQDPVVSAIQEHAKLQKLQSTFVTGIQRAAYQGRVHPTFNQMGAVSGRLSCSDPNLQQIPSRSERGKRVRDVFVASPGNVLVVADLSQIELRMLAHFTRDRRLLEAYQEGLDLHGAMAERVFGSDYTAIQRSLAKNAHFCVPMNTEALTRRGWKAFADIEMSDEVLGYDAGVLRWTPVIEKVYFDDAPLVEIKSKHFSAVTTPNHRWIGEQRHREAPWGSFYYEPTMLETKSIGAEDRIILSASLEAEGVLDVTAEEAALLARFWAASAFNRSPHAESAVSPDFPRDLWERCGLDERSPVEFVAALSSAAVAAFAQAAWEAAGDIDQRGAKIRAQNEGPVFDAFALAVFLTGHSPVFCSNGAFEGTEDKSIRFGKPYVAGHRLTLTERPNAPVWCLRTGLGSWVMRQGGQIALTGNSVLYGAGPATMVRRYQIPNLRMAKALLDAFYRSYPRVQPWKDRVLAEARGRRKRGVDPYVLTILGRKRRLPELMWGDKELRSAAERQAISVTISGSAADLFKVIMVECYWNLLEQSWGDRAHILMTVHDELVVEVPKRYAEEGFQIVKSTMEDVKNPHTGKPFLSVPIVADAKIVQRWSEAK